jgi:hypothetical protein
MASIVAADKMGARICANDKYFCANHSCIGFFEGYT